MSEFCFECYRKYFDENAKKENLVMDEGLDLCEGCGEYKQTVITVQRPSVLRDFYYWLKRKK